MGGEGFTVHTVGVTCYDSKFQTLRRNLVDIMPGIPSISESLLFLQRLRLKQKWKKWKPGTLIQGFNIIIIILIFSKNLKRFSMPSPNHLKMCPVSVISIINIIK